MVDLATMLIERQSGKYDPSDIEDRYETRLRAMLDAKIAGHDPERGTSAPADDTNVIDLMAALRRSLGQPPTEERPMATAPSKPAKQAKQPVRNQPGLKLPIKGGKAATDTVDKPAIPQPAVPAAKPSRKRA